MPSPESDLVERVPISCCSPMAAAVDDTLIKWREMDHRYTLGWPVKAGGGWTTLSFCPWCGTDLEIEHGV